eukprot:3420965-Pyramimonas_sp.AAC.1
MGEMSNNKCCPKPTAAAVVQAAFCLKWTKAAAALTASPVQNEPDPVLRIVPLLSVPIAFGRARAWSLPIPSQACTSFKHAGREALRMLRGRGWSFAPSVLVMALVEVFALRCGQRRPGPTVE